VHASVRNALSPLVLASCLGLAGCLEVPSSLNPVFPAADGVSVEGIEGFWREADGNAGLSIRADGEGAYEMVLWDKDRPSTDDGGPYELRFARIGDALYWDLTAKGPKERSSLGIRRVHVPARIRLEGGVLEIAFLQEDALRPALESGELTLAHVVADDDVVLTGPTAELTAFLEEHGAREDLFDEPARFQRRRAPRP